MKPKNTQPNDCINFECELCIYPSHAERGLISGIGFVSIGDRDVVLKRPCQDFLKFYEVDELLVFLFLGPTLYHRELHENFGLKPFMIGDGVIRYYSNHVPPVKLVNWDMSIGQNEQEFFDEETDGLNPLIHLASALNSKKWRKGYYKEMFVKALKLGFLQSWLKIPYSNYQQMEDTRSKSLLERTVLLLGRMVELDPSKSSLSERVLQKELNRSVNDIVASNVELMKALRGVAVLSGEGSALRIFEKLYQSITEDKIKKRIKYADFPTSMYISRVGIGFKATLPKEATERLVDTLGEKFENVEKSCYPFEPSADGRKPMARKSLLSCFYFDFKLQREDYKTAPITVVDHVNSELDRAMSALGQTAHRAWHISKAHMWVRNISIEIETPTYLKELLVETLKATSWFAVLTQETVFKNRCSLNVEIWFPPHHYSFYSVRSFSQPEQRCLLDPAPKEKWCIEEMDEELYQMTLPQEFLMDCAYFFTLFDKKLHAKYRDLSNDPNRIIGI